MDFFNPDRQIHYAIEEGKVQHGIAHLYKIHKMEAKKLSIKEKNNKKCLRQRRESGIIKTQ